MYEVPAQDAPLGQGDILRGPFVFPYTHNPAEELMIVREQAVLAQREIADAWSTGSEVVVLPAQRTDFAIVLSNTCDLVGDDRREPLEFVKIGAILPLDSILHERERGNCRRNRFFRYHYLRADGANNIQESYVHFGLTALVRHEALLEWRQNRVLALLSPHKENLGHRFGEFFSRVAVP